jgi:hypothetical protein
MGGSGSAALADCECAPRCNLTLWSMYFYGKVGSSLERSGVRQRYLLMKEITVRLIRLLLLVSAMFVVGPGSAVAQSRSPCLLVCFPPEKLDAEKCACTAPRGNSRVCGLVCFNPDETLDAKRCRCVKSR